MGNRVWGGLGGCERRIEVFVKIQKKKNGGLGEGVGFEGGRVGGQGGCERRIKVFEKIHKKNRGSGRASVGGSCWWGEHGVCERNVGGRG